MSLPEVVFPRNPGQPGQGMHAAPFNPELLDFDELEWKDWPNDDMGGRCVWVTDPFGTGRTVLKQSLFYGDLCTKQYGPDAHRIEMWKKESHDQVAGTEAWFAFSRGLGDGATGELFKYGSPDWAMVWQNHEYPGDPLQALEISKGGEWIMNCRKQFSDESGRRNIAVATLGHWHHFLVYVKFSRGQDGIVRTWHGLDTPPDPTTPPADERFINTLGLTNTLPTRCSITLYRAETVPADYPWTSYHGGYARAATAARAQALAWPGAVTPPPPPPPSTSNAQLRDQAVQHLKATTRGYKNKYWATPPAGSEWQQALDLLGRIS